MREKLDDMVSVYKDPFSNPTLMEALSKAVPSQVELETFAMNYPIQRMKIQGDVETRYSPKFFEKHRILPDAISSFLEKQAKSNSDESLSYNTESIDGLNMPEMSNNDNNITPNILSTLKEILSMTLALAPLQDPTIPKNSSNRVKLHELATQKAQHVSRVNSYLDEGDVSLPLTDMEYDAFYNQIIEQDKRGFTVFPNPLNTSDCAASLRGEKEILDSLFAGKSDLQEKANRLAAENKLDPEKRRELKAQYAKYYAGILMHVLFSCIKLMNNWESQAAPLGNEFDATDVEDCIFAERNGL